MFAVDENGGVISRIFYIDPDGYIVLFNNIDKKLGFHLDNGYIKIEGAKESYDYQKNIKKILDEGVPIGRSFRDEV